MMWETVSKGCMLCSLLVGSVVDCKLYLDVGDLVRISARSGVVAGLLGIGSVRRKCVEKLN